MDGLAGQRAAVKWESGRERGLMRISLADAWLIGYGDTVLYAFV